MNALKRIIKRILCKHDYEVTKEVEFDICIVTALKCILCDKVKILMEYND